MHHFSILTFLNSRIFALAALSCVFAPSSWAQIPEIEPLINRVESEVRSSGEENFQQFVAFRKQVEANAFADTLKLCQGYRKARGMEPVIGHEGQMPSLEDSIGAWEKVLNNGLAQPFSAVAGIKATSISYNHVPIWSSQFWFGSVYSMTLLNSWGFLDGAVHCLNTVDQREIRLFAIAIAAADYGGSGASDLGLEAAAGAAVVPALARLTRFVFWPARYLVQLLRLRVSRTPLVLAGTIVLPIAADNFVTYMSNLERAHQYAVDLLSEGSAVDRANQRSQRAVLMAAALRKFMEEWKSGDPNVPQFRAWARSHVTPAILQLAHADLLELKVETPDPQDPTWVERHRQILEAILPILDQIALPG